MHLKNTITLLGAHAEGEVGRVITSGVIASMYGAAVTPLSNVTLKALGSAALAVVWRSTARCASE